MTFNRVEWWRYEAHLTPAMITDSHADLEEALKDMVMGCLRREGGVGEPTIATIRVRKPRLEGAIRLVLQGQCLRRIECRDRG